MFSYLETNITVLYFRYEAHHVTELSAAFY